MFVLVLFVLITTDSIQSQEYDFNDLYCDPEICKIFNGTDFNYLQHIACDNNGTFDESCLDAIMVDMNQRRKNLILDLHNSARNRVAMGLLPGYESAAKMPVLKWDNELQFLASLNVKTCQFAHDKCRNTDQYLYSGQNIGIIWQSFPIHSNSKRMKYVVGSWFREYHDANQSFVDEYDRHPEGKQIGHFTTMIADRATRVGCSAARFTDAKGRLTFLMTCNYDFTSVFGQPIYEKGPTLSNCTVRKSGRFPGLCEWDNDYEDSEESNEIDSSSLVIEELL